MTKVSVIESAFSVSFPGVAFAVNLSTSADWANSPGAGGRTTAIASRARAVPNIVRFIHRLLQPTEWRAAVVADPSRRHHAVPVPAIRCGRRAKKSSNTEKD